MWKLIPIWLAFVIVAAELTGQQPGGPQGQGPSAQKQQDFSDSPIVTQMMAFNKKKDGKLTREEVTDPRLLRLFDQADTNKDGVVTREELTALAAKLDAEYGQGGPGGKGDKGPGGPKGKGGPGGPKGKGKDGPGGFGGPPRPGQILPTFLQDQLNLSGDQKKQLNDLQKDVDAKLDKLLTDQQRKQLQEMGKGGPGGFGPGGPGGSGGFGPGGPGGPGGFGGGPPKGKPD